MTIPGTANFLDADDVPFTVTLTLANQEVLGATVTADLTGPDGFSRSFVGIPLGATDGTDTVTFGPSTVTFDVKVVEATTTPDTTIQGTVTLDKIETVFVGYGFGYKGAGGVSDATITIDGTLSLPPGAPTGDYKLKITVDNGLGDDFLQSASVDLIIFASLTTTLPKGWSTYSIPIAAEFPFFFFTTGTGTGDQNGMVDADKVDVAYRFNAATAPPAFELIVKNTATNSLLPTEAVYVKSKESHTATLIVQNDQTGPPSRLLPANWNLVGLAIPLGTASMSLDQALISVKEDTDGNAGYTIVVSPSVNDPDDFIWTLGQSVAGKDLKPSRGYWVFMDNEDTLAGFSTTPVE